MTTKPDREWVPLSLLITLFGLGLRWYVVLIARPTCGPGAANRCFLINGDVQYHFTQAQMLADGYWFKNGLEYSFSGTIVDSAGDPPIWASVLGLWSFLGFDTVHWQRFLTTFIGAATVFLVAMLANRLGGPRAAAIAAFIAAIHPLLWINDAMLMSEAIYQPVIVILMLITLRYADEPKMNNALLVGLMIGLAALTRAEAVSLGLFLLLPLMGWAKTLSLSERFKQLMAAGIVALLVMAPWLIFNNVRFEKPVTLTAASGTVLMAGSCDAAWSGPRMGAWADCFADRNLFPEYEATFPNYRNPDPAQRVIYDESVRDAFDREKALDYIGDNLGRLPLVVVARIGRALDFYGVGDTLRNNWELEGRWKGPSTFGLALYYALVIPSLAGLVILRRQGRRLTPLLVMWPMVMFAAASTFGLTRYRVPVDLAMIVLSGIALDALVTNVRHRLSTS